MEIETYGIKTWKKMSNEYKIYINVTVNYIKTQIKLIRVWISVGFLLMIIMSPKTFRMTSSFITSFMLLLLLL